MNGDPVARRGEVIGLLGGSFDPAHEGHRRITLAALHRFGLDRVWWLVSPGNPLKPEGPAPMADRIARAQAVMDDRRVTITDIEARLGTRQTARTIERLMARYPGVRFVWLMGADNLRQFHRWHAWREIMARVPVGVLARPGDSLAGLAPAARAYQRARIPAHEARSLGRASPPAWCFLTLPLSDAASSAIRRRGQWVPAAG